MDIQLSLLGPFHDGRIHLHYTGVTKYSLSAVTKNEHTAHGDLLTHEIRVGESGTLIHELLFEMQASLEIECLKIHHSEELMTG